MPATEDVRRPRSPPPPTRSPLDTTGLTLPEVVDRIVTFYNAGAGWGNRPDEQGQGRRRRPAERRQIHLFNRLAGDARRPCPRSPRVSPATAGARPASGTAARFTLIDTGGLDALGLDLISGLVREQARAALAEAAVALFVVDGRAGVRPATRSSPTRCAAPTPP